ncbi:MAG TPA: hypothetical protein DCE43_11990 [Planctomycetaceae bacterium]|nr:hypothetical protein [Planctomycetaceae bacterium]
MPNHPDHSTARSDAQVAVSGPAALDSLAAALSYRSLDWSVFPIRYGEKRPRVRWKGLQECLPDRNQVGDWFGCWPEDGIAVALGPLSGLLAIDVDGQEAHAELCNRLGTLPVTPAVKSGNPDPHRYHLFFKHPANLETRAKATPWHDQLEFRGHGGYIVLPPSVHKSGQRYAWLPGRSLEDVPLATLPDAIDEALKQEAHRRRPLAAACRLRVSRGVGFRIRLLHGISNDTRTFLSGRYADGPLWNQKLFRAACDLAGCGYDSNHATELLLAGARPWNSEEEQRALATIQSAFSQPRQPARSTALDPPSNRPVTSWEHGRITINEIGPAIQSRPEDGPRCERNSR